MDLPGQGFACLVLAVYQHQRRAARIAIRPDRGIVRTLARGALPFFAYWVLGSLYFRLDTVLLSKLADAATLGMRTVLIGSPRPEGPRPDHVIASLRELLGIVG